MSDIDKLISCMEKQVNLIINRGAMWGAPCCQENQLLTLLSLLMQAKGIRGADSFVRSTYTKYLAKTGFMTVLPINKQTENSNISCHLFGFCETINAMSECLYNKTIIELE